MCQENAKKAHSLIHNCCNEAMQIRSENDSKFEEEVKGDPFKIVTAMKLKMHDPSKVKCPCVTLFKQLERLLSTKQEEEPLICTLKKI